MRIACYGLVDRDAGSVASANFLIVDELLNRGYEVHFFAKRDFVKSEHLDGRDGFVYHGIQLERPTAIKDKVERWLFGGLERVAEETLYQMHLQAIYQAVRAAHEQEPFDVILFLGLGAQFSIQGLYAVSWLQGPPQTEWESLRSLKPVVLEYGGRILFEKLRLYYVYRRRQALREIARADTVICGSRWAREKVIESGVQSSKVHALPYPFDLTLFKPEQDAEPRHPGRTTLLWLGRVDPRKRLDLLMPAFQRLIDAGMDVHLEIIARFSYAPGLKRLIDGFAYPERVTYRSHVDRQEVPRLMNQVDVMVQPSENENFGSSVAEALACGVPVVLGPTNGTAEYAGDAVFTFERYEAEALARSLEAAFTSVQNSKQELRHNARAAAEEFFRPAVVVDALTDLMESHTRGANRTVENVT